MSARQPGWRRASAPSQRSIGSSSASSPSIWPSATASACRLAGGSATPSSQPRVAPDSSPWVGRGSPWWNKAAWMRCCQAVRWSTRVLRSRTVVRKSRIQVGGIHEQGSRPCSSSSRSSRASVRSVLARRLGPRRLLVSAGSARWATNPAAWSSSTTNRQPVQPSTANPPPAPGSSPSQAPTPARVAGVMRPRRASPLSRSTQSKVIWARCTSSPPRMLIGTSFEFRPCGRQHDHPCLSRRGSLHMSSFFGGRPEDFVLHGQLPDLAFGLPQRPIISRPVRPLALQRVLAALQEVVPPGRQPVRLHLQLPGELFQRLAAQQPQDRLHLLARRPPRPGPVVTGLLVLVLVVHRHDRHLHLCLLGVQ